MPPHTSQLGLTAAPLTKLGRDTRSPETGESRPRRAVGSPAEAAGGADTRSGPTTPEHATTGTQPATQGCLSNAPQAAKPGSELNSEH